MDYFGKTTLAEMRALSFDELTEMTNEYSAATNSMGLRWRPVIDNYFLTGTFSEVARAGEIANIPYIFGFTANDSRDASQAIADFCMLREKQGKPAYAYMFARQLPGDENGAFHSSDLWYVFHSFRYSWRPFTAGDEALSLQMVDYWTNFAKDGDPNGQSGVIWTPYTTESPEFMVLDVNGDEASLTMTDSPKYLGPSPRK